MVLLFFASLCLGNTVGGERMQWHRVSVTFDGPPTGEQATPNPFLDYRLEVTFTHEPSGRVLRVPGFYAADGNAAETSSDKGGKWRAHFMPDAAGRWSYRASFRAGPGIALSSDPGAGESAAFDGASGVLEVAPTNKTGRDFRGKGLLRYTGEHYLSFAGTGEYYLKGGADSPENFLAYYEFDGTWDLDARFNEGENTTGKPFVHHYEPHARDWRQGDPTWQGGKGRNIIGALNYLASKGMNSVYFLTYNIDGGDGKDVWVWTSPEERHRFDVSKLDQCEIVFSHMDRLGLMLHVITQETENDHRLGGSASLNPVRKLYLRELVARFAHHPALVWNLGEENNTPDADRKEIAAWIRGLDAYAHPITVHSHVNRAHDDYKGILGAPHFEAASIQSDPDRAHGDAVAFRRRSAEAGRKWVVFYDEQSPAEMGVLPDKVDQAHDIPRIEGLWGNLMGGGAGVEWYFGYHYPNMDLNCEDWRSRDAMWDQTRIALEFFQRHLPFHEMEPLLNATEGSPARVFAVKGRIYAVQLTRGGAVKLQLEPGDYSVEWFNPRAGGPLLRTKIETVNGGRARPYLGMAPSEPDKDWIILLKKK